MRSGGRTGRSAPRAASGGAPPAGRSLERHRNEPGPGRGPRRGRLQAHLRSSLPAPPQLQLGVHMNGSHAAGRAFPNKQQHCSGTVCAGYLLSQSLLGWCRSPGPPPVRQRAGRVSKLRGAEGPGKAPKQSGCSEALPARSWHRFSGTCVSASHNRLPCPRALRSRILPSP